MYQLSASEKNSALLQKYASRILQPRSKTEKILSERQNASVIKYCDNQESK
jgi:hypothetical protein